MTTTPQILKAEFDELVRAAGLVEVAAEAGHTTMSHTDAVLLNMLSVSPEMENIKNEIRKFAPSDLSVLILGKTGTGKELVAQALHGDRKPNTFVPVNCGAIPSELLESELFGAKKGAYTGAVDRAGLVELAHDGTLFLDEIGDMPPLLQCKLLRTLNDKKYRRVGETQERSVNFRLVSATNHMEIEKAQGFRSDLYYRIAEVVIKLPTLKERGPLDLALIANSFADSPGIAEMAIMEANRRDMDGNIRELRSLVRKLNVLYGHAKS